MCFKKRLSKKKEIAKEMVTRRARECLRANTVVCNAKLNHACTYFVCSSIFLHFITGMGDPRHDTKKKRQEEILNQRQEALG